MRSCQQSVKSMKRVRKRLPHFFILLSKLRPLLVLSVAALSIPIAGYLNDHDQTALASINPGVISLPSMFDLAAFADDASEDLPQLGDYPDTTIALSSNAVVVPSSAPVNTTRVSIVASAGFRGALSVDTFSGAVRITNAYHASSQDAPYMITLTALGPGGSTTRSFLLTVTSGIACTQS